MKIDWINGNKTPAKGDIKTMKNGDKFRRIKSMVNIGTPFQPHMAYNCTGGHQNYEWEPYV
jgi:hypothetical protein